MSSNLVSDYVDQGLEAQQVRTVHMKNDLQQCNSVYNAPHALIGESACAPGSLLHNSTSLNIRHCMQINQQNICGNLRLVSAGCHDEV